MKKGKSAHGKMHPYLIPNNWLRGKFSVWEEHPQRYTEWAHEYYRDMIDRIRNDVKIAHLLDDNLHQ